jgi:predicted P-loop ATPase
MKISIFSPYKKPTGEWVQGVKPSNVLIFEQYLENIRSGLWQDYVINVRNVKQNGTKEQYQAAKVTVPAVTASGIFAYRNAKGLEAHSGFIAIDIDSQDNTNGIPIDQLAADVYTYAIHRSIGGDGVVVYVKIDTDKHLEAFLGLEVYYANQYQIEIDPSCKDVSRLRYVSWDEDLHINPKAIVFKKYIPKKQQQPVGRVYTQTNNDIEYIINQVVSRGVNLAENYNDWLNVGFGFAREYGEAGRQYFHDVSGQSAKYNREDCDKKYSHLLSRSIGGSASGRTTGIGTFVWLAQQAGLEIKTPRTQHIENVAKLRAATIGQNGGLKDKDSLLQSVQKQIEMDGITSDADVKEIVEKVASMSGEQMKGAFSGDMNKDAKLWVSMQGLRFNEITRAVESNAKPINDYDANSMYLKMLETLAAVSKEKKEISKQRFDIILESDAIETYHPFKEFLQGNAQMKPEGLIQELVQCLIFPADVSQKDAEDLRYFAIKWLISIIASMHGTYSIMCLVLCGKMGKGKTEFFRRLLPPALADYYGESKLDKEKDDEILMTQKLILCDDEFGGKSKKDALKLREILAKQRFTVRAPYARRAADLLRIAVLCGTSNEKDILIDLEGNRRIIPLNIERIDFERYKKIDKTMLFMEMYYAYIEVGDSWMLTEADVKRLNELTISNEENCLEMEAFSMFFSHPNEGGFVELLTPTEIRHTIEMNTRFKISPKRLGAALRKAGFVSTKKLMECL